MEIESIGKPSLILREKHEIIVLELLFKRMEIFYSKGFQAYLQTRNLVN